LVRQLLAESFLLAFLGAICGAVIAQVLSRLLTSFLSTQRSEVFLDLAPDWRVLGFTALLAVVTCIIFGLMPAVQASRTQPGEAMKATTRGNTATRSSFNARGLLV